MPADHESSGRNMCGAEGIGPFAGQDERFTEHIGRFNERGFAVIDGFLSREEVAYWRAAGTAWRHAGRMQPAGVGRGDQRNVRAGLRNDAIAWIDPDTAHPVESLLARSLEQLRLAINVRCLLGLLDIEIHLATYPPGGFYRAHVDRFRDDDARVVSLVCWLNEGWQPEHGGVLRLWPDGPDAPHVDVEPRSGRAIVFLAADTLHEVRETHAERRSLTGWFRRRPM